ncbi:hypothetical protein LX92_01172 [Maribacter polysiphoniae]|uniref:Uncharacterized protein n=1 Tax=Maribacter polysiphoniae TaxID=429344 RepID=A0A316E2D6_9FLAO|nr:hypothetical protein LX92_01172 [Maribacter polysiphoniae]
MTNSNDYPKNEKKNCFKSIIPRAAFYMMIDEYPNKVTLGGMVGKTYKPFLYRQRFTTHLRRLGLDGYSLVFARGNEGVFLKGFIEGHLIIISNFVSNIDNIEVSLIVLIQN